MSAKKITGFILAVFMTATVFTGCNNTGNGTSTPGGNNSGASTPANLSGTVKTGGSTSVEKVMEKLIEQFEDDNGSVKIEYEGNGSGDGIVNTKSGLYEVGHSSRELKKDGSEDGLDEIPYAIDGIAVVVHKDNPVQNLTKQQIFEIYTGVVKNWKDVGGNDAPITVITREAGSGTRSAMADIIGLEKKVDGVVTESTKIWKDANEAGNTGAVQTQVSGNKNAIGYMSFSDVNPAEVKMVQYEGVEISTDNLYNDSYKLKRNFYLLKKTGSTLSPEAQAFINFVLSEEGQTIVKNTKLLPIQ